MQCNDHTHSDDHAGTNSKRTGVWRTDGSTSQSLSFLDSGEAHLTLIHGWLTMKARWPSLTSDDYESAERRADGHEVGSIAQSMASTVKPTSFGLEISLIALRSNMGGAVNQLICSTAADNFLSLSVAFAFMSHRSKVERGGNRSKAVVSHAEPPLLAQPKPCCSKAA
jgi:hypothetical protein